MLLRIVPPGCAFRGWKLGFLRGLTDGGAAFSFHGSGLLERKVAKLTIPNALLEGAEQPGASGARLTKLIMASLCA